MNYYFIHYFMIAQQTHTHIVSRNKMWKNVPVVVNLLVISSFCFFIGLSHQITSVFHHKYFRMPIRKRIKLNQIQNAETNYCCVYRELNNSSNYTVVRGVSCGYKAIWSLRKRSTVFMLSKKTRLRLSICQIIKILLNINNLIINIGVTFRCF